MTLPGFTAETSLYRTNGQYRTTHAQHQFQATVFPAQSNIAGCTTYSVTDCCTQDSYYPNCLRCSRYNEYGALLTTWDSGVCSSEPCPYSEVPGYDERGCAIRTITYENCWKETVVDWCPRPDPGTERIPNPLTILKG